MTPTALSAGQTARRIIRAAFCTLVLQVCLQPLVHAAGPATELPGRVVAIWSKGAGKFVRSAGADDGVLRADRDSYDSGDEGRFLCFSEVGGTFAFMDVMLERYLTHDGGQLTSAVSGSAASRRFTLVDQGNHYYAIRADNGNYVRVNGAGDMVADAVALNDDAVFAIVPIRTGPNVVMRAYNGDDPFNQLPSIPNELAMFVQNPADFPVNKVNIGTLQMTAPLSSDQQLIDMRRVWNTKRFEDEAIIPYDVNLPLVDQLDGMVNGIRRMESLGYTYDYIILYHEILANLPAGPWSDPRISSLQEISLLRERILLAHNRGELSHPSYKIFCMPYQFETGTTLGIAPHANTPVGCDAATLAFIKQNFDGMFLEVNGHDYLKNNEHIDAARAAVWCRDNGLEFGITSGLNTNKDTNYKSMYQEIFAEMAKVGFDKSWDKMQYVLHHVYQPYQNRLPEWVANTTTDNARWLIENVMPLEAPSISPTLDTDGDGVPDLEEAVNGTFPLGPGGPALAPPVFDDFSTYTAGNLRGQTGGSSPVGFETGAWQSNNGAAVPVATTVSGGVVTSSGNGYRTHRALSPPILTGTVYLRTNMALGTAPGSFQALELTVAENDGDINAVRLIGGTNLRVDVRGGGMGATITTNDGANHEWLIELDLTTGAGKAWIDGNTAAFNPGLGGTVFTASPGFTLNAINIATFAAPGETPSIALDEIRIGRSWSSIGVTLASDTYANWISGYNVGGQTGLGDDPDGDGIDNGVENFFGTVPDAFSQGMIAGVVTGNQFTFTHPRGTMAGDLTATYLWSTDLVTFHGDGAEVGGTTITFTAASGTPTPGISTVTATVMGNPVSKLFIKIAVTGE